MSQKKVCPHCEMVVSADKYHKHLSRGRCDIQHIRQVSGRKMSRSMFRGEIKKE